MKKITFWLAIAALLITTTARAIGVEEAFAPDPDDKPLAVRIWYPSNSNQPNVVLGDQLPLIIISHGAGGSNADHEDTARALAEAGFVVAAITHTGDNYKDLSYVRQGKQLIVRPRHVTRTVDYMLTSWHAHQKLDSSRIGMFGMSAGGFTALVVAGGQPDLKRTANYCQKNPKAWTCEYLRKNGVTPGEKTSPAATAWMHDARIKAAVIAVPAVGYSFESNGLANVHIPIQLWSAEHDGIVDISPDIVRRLLPALTDDHRVAGAGHFSFVASCGIPKRAIITVMSWFGTEKICSDPKGFDRQRFHDEFNASIVQFLSAQLSRKTNE